MVTKITDVTSANTVPSDGWNWLVDLIDTTGVADANLKFTALSGDPLIIGTTQFVIKSDGKVGVGTASPSTELHVSGGIIVTDLTASEIVATDGSKNLQSLAVASYPSLTELAYVKGVTSAVQTQIDTKADDELTLNDQTGTTYTLVLTDQSKLVTMSNASAITMTVPPNSSVAFPIGTQILLYNKGAGQVTVAEGSGVTINTSQTLIMRAQYSTCGLIKIGTDEWIFFGDMEAA